MRSAPFDGNTGGCEQLLLHWIRSRCLHHRRVPSKVRHRILHSLHDEANHGGEMGLLRNTQNAGNG